MHRVHCRNIKATDVSRHLLPDFQADMEHRLPLHILPAATQLLLRRSKNMECVMTKRFSSLEA
jgi:hypothetical protein